MDNAFDRQIKSALEQFELPYEASTWAALEQRLEQLPGQTDTVDQALKSILQNAEMPYQPTHWDLLTQKMAAETKRRRRVLLMKILEAAAVLLLLFWAMPGSQSGLDDIRDASTQTTVAENDQKKSAKNANKRNSLTPLPTAQQQLSALHQQEIPLTEMVVPGESFTVQNNVAQGWDIRFQTTDHVVTTTETNLPTTQEQPSLASQSLSIEEIDFLGQKAFIILSANQPQKSFASIPQKAKRQSRMYVAAMASFDQNRIKTTAPGLQRTQGYGSGILLGYHKNKWAVETGLTYKRKTYTPRKEVEIISGDINKGYNGQFVQQVDADILSVPVQAVRQLARLGGRTKIKANAGIVAHVVLNKAYDAQNVFYPGFQTSGPTDPPQFSAAYNGRGVLENGGLDGNAYLSLNAGVRLEHSLNAQTAVFAEASYQQALGGGKGIGPKPARIHTAGLSAGVIQRI
jgi:hypothetical protein